MADYTYQGVDKEGKKVSGTLAANNEGELRMALRNLGVRPTRIGKAGILNADVKTIFKSTGTVKSEALVNFTRQLNVLISSGIPLVQALEILSEQSAGNLKGIINTMRERVSAGSYIWEAMAAYPRVFPKLYIALIKAGESSGSLDQMLKRLTRYLEDAERLRRLMKSAMIYPVAVVAIGVGVVTLMLAFVIPKFEELLAGSGESLPLPTQIVISLSHFIVNNGLYLIAGAVAVGYLGMRYFRSPEGRAFLDWASFNAPLFGGLVKKGGIARFARTMQTLLASGVNLLDAIDICKATIDNVVFEEAVSKMRSEVETGKTLSGVLGRMPVFPKMVVQMVSVGESTGNLDKMLEKVADFYEAEVESLVGGLTKLIEPLILVFLGGAVGGLLLAMYLPIFKLAGGGGS